MCCISGCTDTTRSGAYVSKALENIRETTAP